MAVRTLVTIALSTLSGLGVADSASAQRAAPTLDAYLRSIGLDASQRTAAARGRAVARLLPTKDNRDVTVFGVPHSKWGEVPLAAVILREGAKAAPEALRDWINERVHARYQRVSQVAIMADFPRSAAGKTLKRELRDPYWADRDRKI